MNSKTDNLFQDDGAPRPFRFSKAVADVFPDMIARSVPGYAASIELIGVLARRYVRPDSNVYDLGCSLGAATLAMRHQIRAPDVTIHAVDNSAPMVERCRAIIARDTSPTSVLVTEADICDIEIKRASLTVLAYTLQFVASDQRHRLLQTIANGTVAGGAIALIEKVQFESQDDCWFARTHEEFKRMNGYTDMEIAGKRQALENVLVRDSIDVHLRRLREAGFAQPRVVFQALSFVMIVAER